MYDKNPERNFTICIIPFLFVVWFKNFSFGKNWGKENFMRREILNLNEIKDKILAIKGKNVDITINRGRKKFDTFCGMIENIYPSVFTVKIFNDKQLKNVTCSYSDVLCGDVRINEKG